MEELLGVPAWLAISLGVVVGVAALMVFGNRAIGKAHSRLAGRRTSPTRDEFMGMLPEMRAETAAFLWEKALFYVQPRLTPHPDDELASDLRIDDDDWGMDWPRDFARGQEFHESNFPDWPENWPVTLRNYGRWLEMGPS